MLSTDFGHVLHYLNSKSLSPADPLEIIGMRIDTNAQFYHIQPKMCTTDLLMLLLSLSLSRSSWAVLLLVALLSIGYVTHGDENVKHSKPGKTGVFESAILDFPDVSYRETHSALRC